MTSLTNKAASFGKALHWFQEDVEKIRIGNNSEDAIALTTRDFVSKTKHYLIETRLLLPIMVMVHDHYSKTFVLHHLHLELDDVHVSEITTWIKEREDVFGL